MHEEMSRDATQRMTRCVAQLKDHYRKMRTGRANVGLLDGLKVDAKGNIFATGPGGILVLSPEGKHLGTIYPGDLVANCAFGDDGSTLYMTVNRQLMRVRTQTKGLGF